MADRAGCCTPCPDLVLTWLPASRRGFSNRWRVVKKVKGPAQAKLGRATRLVQGYVEHYNNIRLNSAIGYVTPRDMLAGRQQEIHATRDRKLAAARQQRQVRRQLAAEGIMPRRTSRGANEDSTQPSIYSCVGYDGVKL